MSQELPPEKSNAALAAKLARCPLGWLPGTGDVVSIAITPAELGQITKALLAFTPSHALPKAVAGEGGAGWAVWINEAGPYLWSFAGDRAELQAKSLAEAINRQCAPSTTPQKTGETPLTDSAALWLMAEGPLPAGWKCPRGQEADIRQFNHELLGPCTEWKVVTAAIARRLERGASTPSATRQSILEEAKVAYESHVFRPSPGNEDVCRDCCSNFRNALHFRFGETRDSRVRALHATDGGKETNG